MVSHVTFNIIDMGKPKITVGKSYGLHNFIWEASENNWAVIWGDAIFLLLVCSTDFDILCSFLTTSNFIVFCLCTSFPPQGTMQLMINNVLL